MKELKPVFSELMKDPKNREHFNKTFAEAMKHPLKRKLEPINWRKF